MSIVNSAMESIVIYLLNDGSALDDAIFLSKVPFAWGKTQVLVVTPLHCKFVAANNSLLHLFRGIWLLEI